MKKIRNIICIGLSLMMLLLTVCSCRTEEQPPVDTTSGTVEEQVPADTAETTGKTPPTPTPPTDGSMRVTETGRGEDWNVKFQSLPLPMVNPWYQKIDPIQFDKAKITVNTEELQTVYRTTGAYAYNAWPTVCRDENGVLYTVFSGDRLAHICPFGKNILAKSTDGGKTWGEVSVINDTVMDDRDGGLLYIGEGKMIMTYFCHPASYYLERKKEIINAAWNAGIKDEAKAKLDELKNLDPFENRYGSFIRISADYGKTWGDAMYVPVTSPHGPILHSSGEVLYLGKLYTGGFISLISSKDQGNTWKTVSNLPVPEGYQTGNLFEPHLAELPDGRLMASIRVEKTGAREPFTIYTCFSSDSGKTWTNPQPTGLNGSPPHLKVLSDGSILMTYARRSDHCGIRAVISTDGGASWSEELILTQSDTADKGSDLGYPTTVELDDHTLVTVFYQRIGSDKTPSIVSLRWTLK